MKKYEMVPFKRGKDGDIDYEAIALWTKEIYQDFKSAEFDSAEERLEFISKLEKLIDELDGVKSELHFQKKIALGKMTAASNTGDYYMTDYVGDYRGINTDDALGDKALFIARLTMIVTLVFIAVTNNSVRQNWPILVIGCGVCTYMDRRFIMNTLVKLWKKRLAKKTKMFSEISASEKGIKKLILFLKTMRLRLLVQKI